MHIRKGYKNNYKNYFEFIVHLLIKEKVYNDLIRLICIKHSTVHNSDVRFECHRGHKKFIGLVRIGKRGEREGRVMDLSLIHI